MKSGVATLIIFGALILQVACSVGASAETREWEVFTSDPATFDTSPQCPSYQKESSVEGFVSFQSVCVFAGTTIKIGSFFADGGAPRLAVAYPLDTEFHVVEGICQDVGGCIYSSDGDTLISRYAGDNNRTVATIFQHFSKKIQRINDSVTGKVRYVFDGSSPDYIPVDRYDMPLSIGAVALSHNGKWMAFEEKNVGVRIIDLTNFAMKSVYISGPTYGFGRDPREELAVSDDGSTVVIMGENAPLLMIQVTSTCGSFSEYGISDNEECLWVMPDFLLTFPTLRFASHPVFDSSGRQLSFYIGITGQPSRRVVLRQPGFPAPHLQYLALGDSFSSGEGETNDIFYEMGTNEGLDRCHVSVRAYSAIISRHMNMSETDMKNIACAGAKTTDVIGDDLFYFGQGDRLVNDTQRHAKQVLALDSFSPGWIHQASFVARYQPKIITLGIGGNDAGLMGKLKTCAMPGTCEWAATPVGRRRTGEEIQQVYYKLSEVYRQLIRDSPGSLIYAVGYPQIIENENLCDPVTAVLLSHDERLFMRQAITYLNQIIKSAAESEGLTYVDIENSVSGYELCNGSLSRVAINGLRIGDDIALTQGLPMLRIIGSETFHPTPEGHRIIGDAIVTTYGSLGEIHSHRNYLGGSGPPLLTEYWDENASNPNEMSQFSTDLLASDHINPADVSVKVTVPSGSLDPGSSVRVEVHSEPIALGNAVVGAEGGFSVAVTIPKSLPEGFHAIHVYGTSYSHAAVDLYQVISYGTASSSTTMIPQLASTKEDVSYPTAAVLGVTTSLGNKLSRRFFSPEPTHVAAIILQRNSIFVLALGVGLIGVALLLAGIVMGRKRQRHLNSTQDPGG